MGWPSYYLNKQSYPISQEQQCVSLETYYVVSRRYGILLENNVITVIIRVELAEIRRSRRLINYSSWTSGEQTQSPINQIIRESIA